MADDRQVGPGLCVKLGINTSELVGSVGGIALALNQSLQLFGQFEAMGQEAFNATIGAAERLQEEIQHMAYTTGMSTDQVQKWRAAAIATDTDFSSLSYSMQILSARITDTSSAGTDLRKTLAGMGVSVKDANGNFVDSDTLLKSILYQIDQLPTAQQKDAAAKEIWGRSWANLASMINESDKALAAYQKTTPAFSEEDLKNINDCKTAWSELSDTIYVAGARIGSAVINVGAADQKAMLAAAQADPNSPYSKRILAEAGLLPNNTNDSSSPLNKNYAGGTVDGTINVPGGLAGLRSVDTSALLAGPQTLQAKLDEITNVTLPKYKQAYIDAVSNGASQDDIDKAADAYNKEIEQQETIKDQIRDQTSSYQEMIDITLPQLKEKLEAAKKTGLKTDIEAAQIALDRGINSANDWGAALGKAAISADSIKASITIASGWSSKSVIGSAGSNMASFMIDEMQHGATYQVALDAWTQGVHSYSSWTNKEGTLGAAIDAGITVTRNPGKNEREALAAATTASTPAATTTATTPSEQAKNETKDQKTELDKQLANVKTNLSDTQKAYLTGYLAIEKTDREHWTFLTEEMKTSLGNLTENYQKWVKYVADNPTIMNIGVVMWTKVGADWDPLHNAEFMQTVRMNALITNAPEYASVDLSKIAFAGTSTDKTKSGDTTISVTQTINGNTDPAAVKAATKDGVSEALAEDAISRGALY